MSEAFPIGATRDSEEFRTSSHRAAQFARSFDDANPLQLTGTYAAPVFHHIPVMQSMVEVLGQATKEFVLHGEHDFVFHAPIVPRMRLFSRSTLTGMRGNRAGVALIIRSDIRTHEDQPVSTQFSTCLVRGPASTLALGEALQSRPTVPEAPAATDLYPISLDQTRRYGDAARDYSPYTIDPAAAAQHGFPAPIVHGMLTLSFAARSMVDGHCAGDTPRLRRLGCRFAHPLYLTEGQSLSIRHWSADGRLVGFEASDAAGNLVIRNGYAEVAP